MNTIETIMSRTSVRQYTDKDISEADLKTILKAGMSGPTAMNKRDWHFVVIRNRDTMVKMNETIGKSADPLKDANVAILVCGDMERAFGTAEDNWIVDCAIAAQNMLLSAKSLGIGGVYLAIWPYEKKQASILELFDLDEEEVMPLSIISLGYADEDTSIKPDKPEWEESQIHYEKW